MKKLITIFITIAVFILLGVIFLNVSKSIPPTFGAFAPISSPAIGRGPIDGYLLQTNGATSTWVATSSLGISALGGGVSNWQKETNYSVLNLTPTTTIPVWLKSNLYSSSTAIFSGAGTSTFAGNLHFGFIENSPYLFTVHVADGASASYITFSTDLHLADTQGNILLTDSTEGIEWASLTATFPNMFTLQPRYGGVSGQLHLSVGNITDEVYGYFPNVSGEFALASTTASGYWQDLINNRFGFGTSSPYAKLSIAGATTERPFAISTTTSVSASTTLFMVDRGGWVHFGGGTPVLSSCGTAPTLDANATDQSGTITFGATASGCTLTFYEPAPSRPHCVVTTEAQSLVNAYTYVVTTSSIVITQAASGGTVWDYFCGIGH